jgi:hypothetical protein
MTEVINAYPLNWPVGWPRSESRKAGAFVAGRQGGGGGRVVSVADGIERVLNQLRMLGISRDDIVISSNVPVRLDGMPRSGIEPPDPGVAVYWVNKKKQTQCMPIDRYRRVGDNLAAIAASLEAMRAIERHGGSVVLDRAFTGFLALPAPTTGNGHAWHELLGVPPSATRDQINSAYRRKIGEVHAGRPGGDHDKTVALNLARDQGLAAAGA